MEVGGAPGAAPDEDSPSITFSRDVPYWRVVQSGAGGSSSTASMIVSDQAAFGKLWPEMYSDMTRQPRMPTIDFAHDVVLVAKAGQRANGGTRISIGPVHDDGEKIVAYVALQEPGPSCVTPQSLTWPIDVALMERTAKPIEFAPHSSTRSC